MTTQQCHVAVRFNDKVTLNYRTDQDTAELFAHAAAYLAEITVDSAVDDSMPRLPCEQLWTKSR